MNQQNDTKLPPVQSGQALPDLDPVFVKGGSFLMGNDDADAFSGEKHIRRVSVPSFYLCKFPVTQRLWKAVMGGEEHPSYFQGELRPKENVSWDDILPFLETLNRRPEAQRLLQSLHPPGGAFRLPSEAEWEYAAKGGNAFPETGKVTSEGFKFSGSGKLEEVGWFNRDYVEKFRKCAVTSIFCQKAAPSEKSKSRAHLRNFST